MDKDFNVEIKVRNGRLLSAIRRTYGTIAEMCRQTKLSAHRTSALVTMRVAPTKGNGEPTEMALNVAAAVGMDFEDLWPKHMERLRRKKASFEIEMSAEEVQSLPQYMNGENLIDYRDTITAIQERLSPRERDVIRWRFEENLTYHDIARKLGVGRERIRQIEAKAFRKMRWWAARKKIDKSILLDRD